MTFVTLREVGPRDGLQVEAPLPVSTRVALIEALIAAGLREIEAVAFVSPKAVPSMADAAAVLGLVPRDAGVGVGVGVGVRYWALVPNQRGASMALDAGVDGLSVTVSASEVYSQRNVHMSVDESVASAAAIASLVDGRVPIDAVVSCAFGSPYEGDLSPELVSGLGQRLLEGGATSLTYADTTGMGTPRLVSSLLALTGVDVGLHLHETRGTALVNAYAALEAGVTRFDTSIGGLGGSPFAAGAGGNLATEDFVHLLDDLGVATGIDLDRLLAASSLVAGAVGHDVPSRVAASGPRSRLAAG
jgi:hydroxymethylglutaryl-CoA lyase